MKMGNVVLSTILTILFLRAVSGAGIARGIFTKIIGKSVANVVPDAMFKRLLRVGKWQLKSLPDLIERGDYITRDSAGKIVRDLIDFEDVTFDTMKKMAIDFKDLFTRRMAGFEFEIPVDLAPRFGGKTRLTYEGLMYRLNALTDPDELVRQIKGSGLNFQRKVKLSEILDDRRISFANKADMLYALKREGLEFDDVVTPREMITRVNFGKERLSFVELQELYFNRPNLRSRSEPLPVAPSSSRRLETLRASPRARGASPVVRFPEYTDVRGNTRRFREKYFGDFPQLNSFFSDHGYFPLFDRIQQVLERGLKNPYSQKLPTIPGTRLTSIDGKPIIPIHRQPGKFEEFLVPVPPGFRKLSLDENAIRNPNMAKSKARLFSDYGLYARDPNVPGSSADGWILMFRVYEDGSKTWVREAYPPGLLPTDLSFARQQPRGGTALGFPAFEKTSLSRNSSPEILAENHPGYDIMFDPGPVRDLSRTGHQRIVRNGRINSHFVSEYLYEAEYKAGLRDADGYYVDPRGAEINYNT